MHFALLNMFDLTKSIMTIEAKSIGILHNISCNYKKILLGIVRAEDFDSSPCCISIKLHSTIAVTMDFCIISLYFQLVTSSVLLLNLSCGAKL